MSQGAGIAVFGAVILVVLVLVFSLRKGLGKKRAVKKPQLFDRMRSAVEEAVPQAKGYSVVMAQAEKDTMSLLKETGGDFVKQFAVAAAGAALGVRARLHTYGEQLPKFVLAYQGDEFYAVCVGYPTLDKVQADTDCMFHLTRQTVEKIKLGVGGGVTFYLQGGAQFIVSLPAAAASEIEQSDEIKKFKAFMADFAQVVNE